MEKVMRPTVVEEEHLTFLDELRESGATNMFGAAPYLESAFDLERKEARIVLSYWMQSFSERHN
tara:strand:- start:269 stop:460 length:192 start_codon:yes stop_codon:yes gene_type:complete